MEEIAEFVNNYLMKTTNILDNIFNQVIYYGIDFQSTADEYN